MRNRLIIILIAVFIIMALILLIARNQSGRVKSLPRSKVKVSAASLLKLAKEKEEKLNLVDAKYIYKKLISEFFDDSRILDWQKKLEEINMKLILSPSIQTESTIMYQVKKGDTLGKIAKRFKTTVELIKKINNLNSDTIRVGRRLKIWTQEFNVVVDKSQNILMLKANDEVIKTYKVSTGKDNSTPIGTFTIKNKIIDPVWYKQGVIVPPESPENILGTRWLGFDLPGYGIHGTSDPSNIGNHVTQGCIRMFNGDIQELFIFLPVGSKVTIID